MVHVRAHDAKLVGSAVGGALVTITDVATGRVLARGRTEGGTGDTRRIMAEPHQRGERLFDTPGAAGFLADVDIRRPTVVEISASGPGSPEDATMCGCPTEPGGMWNADDIQIVARLLDGYRVLDQAPLSFTGTTSQYSGPLTPPAAGSYTLEVLAIDTADANAGRAHRAITAR
jgi:hypothetical protein